MAWWSLVLCKNVTWYHDHAQMRPAMPNAPKAPAVKMKFRKSLNITSRASSITNSFVQAIIPDVPPAPGEIEKALEILGMTYESRLCVYCGTPATDWDHLRPLVKNKQPTGYINEIRNLVPACGPCNQSKSGADWDKWMTGPAKGSPKTKGITDLENRIKRINAFVAWGAIEPLQLEQFAEPALWKAHWDNLTAIEKNMKEAQVHAVQIRSAISKAFEARKGMPVASK